MNTERVQFFVQQGQTQVKHCGNYNYNYRQVHEQGKKGVREIVPGSQSEDQTVKDRERFSKVSMA